jgi:hypothetical protein
MLELGLTVIVSILLSFTIKLAYPLAFVGPNAVFVPAPVQPLGTVEKYPPLLAVTLTYSARATVFPYASTTHIVIGSPVPVVPATAMPSAAFATA